MDKALDAIMDVEDPSMELEIIACMAAMFLAGLPVEHREGWRSSFIELMDQETHDIVVSECDA